MQRLYFMKGSKGKKKGLLKISQDDMIKKKKEKFSQRLNNKQSKLDIQKKRAINANNKYEAYKKNILDE